MPSVFDFYPKVYLSHSREATGPSLAAPFQSGSKIGFKTDENRVDNSRAERTDDDGRSPLTLGNYSFLAALIET